MHQNRDNRVVLRPGKEKPLLQRHPWIFSGAIQILPDFEPGALLPVYSASNQLLGTAYFNCKCNIAGRMVSFGSDPPLEAMKRSLKDAIKWRSSLFDARETDAFRLINGEGDGIPGLIVDLYGDLAVIQCSTLGMDRLKSFVVEQLRESVSLRSIYEKSCLPSRKEEGLSPVEGFLWGDEQLEWQFKESGLFFTLNLKKIQKTGFFLDQREMRKWVRRLAAGKRVFNGFCYTGGFSLYAAAGGAVVVDSADISDDATAAVERHFILNGLQAVPHQTWSVDLFDFLRQEELPYDLVILDPPAFAKKRGDLIPACRGYKDINRLAMQKMPQGSLLLTSSCSHYVDADLFQKVLFQAALEAKKSVKIVGRHQLAPDHPIHLFHPEGEYLKSCLLYVV